MIVLSNSIFDISQYYGSLVVTYLSRNDDLYDEMFSSLKNRGYEFTQNELSNDKLSSSEYINNSNAHLKNCACYLLIMTKELFEKQNQAFRNLIWYQIGYVNTLKQNAIIPLWLGDEYQGILDTPLKNANILHRPADVIRTLSERHSATLLRNLFYSDVELMQLASSRIVYHSVRFQIMIYESAFQKAKEKLQNHVSIRYNNDSFEKYLKRNLKCGFKLFGFSNDQDMIPQLLPYKNEIKSNIVDYSKNSKTTYCLLSESNQSETGCRAKLTMEIFVPVHKLFGSYIKPFLSCGQDCPIDLMLELIKPDFASETAEDDWYIDNRADIGINREEERIYFSLCFKKRPKPLDALDEYQVGKSLDYLFPE